MKTGTRIILAVLSAAVLLGAGAWLAGHAVVAAKLTINFRRMLPLENEVLLETWVERVDGKKVMTRGRIFDQDGETQKVQGDDQATKPRARYQLSPPLAGSLTFTRPEPRFDIGIGGGVRIRDIGIQRHRGFLSHQRSDRPAEICVSYA